MRLVFILALALALASPAWAQAIPPSSAAPAATTVPQNVPAEAGRTKRATVAANSTPKQATDAAPAPPVTLTNEQIKDLIRKSADNDIQNDLKQRDYTYTQRSEAHYLDGQGQVKKVESETDEVMVLYGEQVERKVAKDDKPLSDKDAAKEEKKLQQLIDKRKSESEEKRQKRLAKEAKDREESRQFVTEIADAYNFAFRGREEVDGHNAYVIDCEPRPGYRPHLKDAKYLSKFRARVWIDPAEFQVVKMDAEAIDNVSWGLFLARIQKGAHLVLEQTRVNDEVWLPKHVQISFKGRMALLVGVHMEIDMTYQDYKKFRSSTRILSVSEPSPADSGAPAAAR